MATIEDVLGILKGIPASKFDPNHVRTLLSGVAVDDRSLAPFLHFCDGRYTRNLIHRSDDFELLALCWDGGSHSPIHNHSGQDCWFLVQQGEFCLKGFRIREGGIRPGLAELEHVESIHKVGAGSLDHRGPINDIHQVTVSRGSPKAVSLHVYAKPFDDCLVYDLQHRRCQRQRLRYHTIEGRLVA
jgi:cysteine dioxygenase